MGKRIYQKIKRLFECLLEVLFPQAICCSGCGKDGARLEVGYLCKDCIRLLKPYEGELELCSIKPAFDGYVIGYSYEGFTRDMVHALKYRGEKKMATSMGQLLAACLLERSASNIEHSATGLEQSATLGQAAVGHRGLRQRLQYDVVVPVPLSAQKLGSRGYNQALLIAQELADIIGAKLTDSLARTKDTRPQVLFNSNQRWYNVKGCFHCNRDLTGLSVLLVDDVVTSGATAHYCAEAMKACGATCVTVLAFAKSN